MADIAPHVVFGTRMRQLREARGWRIGELATRSGICRATLYNIQEGRRSCALDIAAAVARALGTTIDAMIAPCACARCYDAPPAGFACSLCGVATPAVARG